MQQVQSFMQRLHNPDAAALFIRIAVGIVFIYAGWFKITNMEMIVGAFGSIGIPAFVTYLVAYIEFLGGIAVLLGVCTRYAALLLSLIMLVATFKVHWPNGFSMATGGYEYTMVLFFAALAIVTLGAGKYSVAHCLQKKMNKA